MMRLTSWCFTAMEVTVCDKSAVFMVMKAFNGTERRVDIVLG